MGKKNKIRPISPAFGWLVQRGLSIFFKRAFNLTAHIPEEVKNLQAPFLLLPNHQGFWDPFLAVVPLRQHVYYIASDAIFRSKKLKFVLQFLGAIPKTKAQSDMDALNHIFALKDQGYSVGIFAEGTRTYDGQTLPLLKSTSKLVRMLKIPVVTVRFKGGYYCHPRWGTSIRKGTMHVEYALTFTGEEVGSMKASEIHETLTKALSFDEVAWQKEVQQSFTSKTPAENIEQLLFTCPACGSMKGFTSKGAEFTCKACDKTWHINEKQELSALSGETHFDNVGDWDRWQAEGLRTSMLENTSDSETIIQDSMVTVSTGFKSQKLQSFAPEGSISITPWNLHIFNKQGEKKITIPIAEMSGINVQNREILDFYYDGTLYALHDPEKHFNAHKWMLAFDLIQRERSNLHLPD